MLAIVIYSLYFFHFLFQKDKDANEKIGFVIGKKLKNPIRDDGIQIWPPQNSALQGSILTEPCDLLWIHHMISWGSRSPRWEPCRECSGTARCLFATDTKGHCWLWHVSLSVLCLLNSHIHTTDSCHCPKIETKTVHRGQSSHSGLVLALCGVIIQSLTPLCGNYKAKRCWNFGEK